MTNIPGFDVRTFTCVIEPNSVPAKGSVMHIARDGWHSKSEQFNVEVRISSKLYKFAIVRDGDEWAVNLVSLHDGHDKLLNVCTFRRSNPKLEFLFEEALTNLVGFAEQQEDE
jgi:hypothetical protein